tara:strand:+ start:2884 stop:4185 length:1302 start_codon:yes stop_codon:yes gene_type:complete
MKIFFSIIIPIYNSERFLDKCIRSLIGQSINNFEILLINDCSSDKSSEICQKYKNNYNFINLINHKKNLGVAKTRNNGIKNSKGKYLVFLDSDDYLYNNSLKNLEKLIKNKKMPEVIFGRFRKKTFPHSNKIIQNKIYNNSNPNLFLDVINKTNFPLEECWPFIVKKSFLIKKNIYFFDVRIGEDELFVARILCGMKNYACFLNKYYYHSDTHNSLSSLINIERTFSYIKLLTAFNKYFKKNELNNIKKQFIDTKIKKILGEISSCIILSNNKEIKFLSKEINKYNISKELSTNYDNINLYYLIKEYGSYDGLIRFKKLIIKSKLLLLNDIRHKLKNIYIYCSGVSALAILKIINKSNFNIKGIIDDNINLKSNKIFKYKIHHSDEFFNKTSYLKISKNSYLIANQRINTFNKIYRKLVNYGINKNLIMHIKF